MLSRRPEQKVPPGSRPAGFSLHNSSAEDHELAMSVTRPRMSSNREPTLSASARNNHSLFSFGGYNAAEDIQSSNNSFDFLPSLNFDDLQSSIVAGVSDDLKLSQFPAPGGQGVFDSKPQTVVSDIEASETIVGIAGSSTNVARHGRTGSILRRQSTSTRQSSASSTISNSSGNTDAQTAPIAVRSKRQSQYPPISGSNTTTKAHRKSIGPGGLDSDLRGAQKRRGNLSSSTSMNSFSDAGPASRGILGGPVNPAADGARLATARASKTKSLQPLVNGQGALSAAGLTPEHNRSASFAGKSPGRSGGRGTSTPSSAARRLSIIPGMPTSASHATGLGARTVSPTDALRLKRLSTLQGPPPMPFTPPPSHPDLAASNRASSRSPSVLPRKTSTPSSSRTTPDINRKSYSSGLSVGSSGSYNTARTSTGSLQARAPQTALTSRLPTPKARNLHSSAGNNEEDVPPVPAIPKAYESPKDSPSEQPFYSKRKSSLPFDTSSLTGSSANELSAPPVQDLARIEGEFKTRRNVTTATSPDIDQKMKAPPPKKKNLQPLRLPPMNLLPLSTPTSAKVAALQEPPELDGQVTPPPRRANAKTPTTPMTASKAPFFSSQNRNDERIDQNAVQMRSSSSNHHSRISSSTIREVSNSGPTMSIMASSRPGRQAVSPFLSSSLPKNGGEYPFFLRSKTSGDFTAAESAGEGKPARLTGPRAQKTLKAQKSDSPTRLSSPDEPTTPSSASSIRRKISLGWRRAASKNSNRLSHAATERSSEHAPQPPKHDNMPPPRLPASATFNTLSSYASGPSPSPSAKSTTYLESKRRKSSASSLNVLNSHERTRSEAWGINRSPKVSMDGDSEQQNPNASRTGLEGTSTGSKSLSSKTSSNTLTSSDPWTVDLDRDDMVAEDEMRRLASKRKETEQAARQLDALRRRATPKERVSPQQAVQIANLNIYERGEIIDYKDVYFCGTQSAAKHVGELQSDAANFGYDDERGDYTIVPGDHLSYRYEIIDILGKGSFGQVVRCIDHRNGTLVAVKIIRNKKRFHQQALVEVNILQKLREWDPKNRHSMVNFTQSFYFRGHLCISTELLDMNLYEFIKSNGFRGFSLKLIRRFTKQLLSSLLLLKQHKVIHCDLKPENILLAHPMHSEIKVIDFGSSCFENEKVYTYIQSRFYRSPEVILGMTYGMPIDMWSVGCIMAELYTGYPIFPGENEQEQLACIMEVFGPPEKHLIEKSTRKKLFFDSLGKPRLTVSSKGRRRKPSSKTLQQVLKCDDEPFLDFLVKCMRWDPDRRMKPDEAVRHEFLTGHKSLAPMARASASVSNSPIKRYNSVATPSTGVRPLPEPPGTAFKTGARTRDPSPGKASGPRRQSTVNGINTTNGSKRVSTGPTAAGSSGLPRVATRSVSARQDLAPAGAAAAMSGWGR